MDTYEEVIYECPDDTFIAIMEDCVNNNLYDKKRKYLNGINEICVYEDGGETKDIENEDVIHRCIAEN